MPASSARVVASTASRHRVSASDISTASGNPAALPRAQDALLLTSSTASRAAVHATDLGILWDDGDGGVLATFGDSYGAGWSAPGAGPRHAAWRCNVLARTPRGEPRDGLVLREWVQDAPGHAAQVLNRG